MFSADKADETDERMNSNTILWDVDHERSLVVRIPRRQIRLIRNIR
jgi:hypothetical protein